MDDFLKRALQTLGGGALQGAQQVRQAIAPPTVSPVPPSAPSPVSSPPNPLMQFVNRYSQPIEQITPALQPLRNWLQQAELAKQSYKQESDQGVVGQHLQQSPITNIGANLVKDIGAKAPTDAASAVKVSPFGQLVQAQANYETNANPWENAKRQGVDLYNALEGAGLVSGLKNPIPLALGGAANVGINAVGNMLSGKKPLEGYAPAFSQGVMQAAPMLGVGEVNPIGREALNQRYTAIPKGLPGVATTIPGRAAISAVRNAAEGAVMGAIQPEEANKRLETIKNNAIFGAVFGALGQAGGDLSDVAVNKVATALKSSVKDIASMVKYGNVPVKTVVDGQETYIPLWKYETLASTVKIPQSKNTETQAYLGELKQKQESARQGEQLGLWEKVSQFYGKLKEQLVNAQAPIEDVLSNAEKKYQFQVRPTADVRLQIDRSLRSNQLAGQFARDNGMEDVIRQAPDLDALDQYLIAKQSQAVEKNGITTGRDAKRDAQLIQDLAPQYEALAQRVNAYSRKLLQYSVQSGLVSQETADMLMKKYPHYVPINRIFSEDELQGVARGTGRGVASLSKQTVVQRLKGSTREIESPIASLLTKTATAFDQGERNIAAQQLASYRNLPGNPFGIAEVPEGKAKGKSTFSAMVQGVKHIYETTPEIAAAAKSLNKEQMGLLAKIISIPTRILRTGAVGINYPFAVANLIKDQTTASINSKYVGTSSPEAFVRGLFSAFAHDDLYQEVVRNAAGGTSFDIGREAIAPTIQEIRRGRTIPGKVANVALSPIRSLEDLIGRTEELTRIQQYKGAYDDLIRQGRTPVDARLLAAQAARENTVNFARGGSISKVINWYIPFFNAGVQGSRMLVRNISNRPLQTMARFALVTGMPVAAATAWNLSDPERKQVYMDIPEYEKQSSIILVPEHPTKNEDGTWNVMKIPLSQEIASLAALVRRPMEQASQLDPVSFGEIANNLIQAGTSLNVSSPTGLASTVAPQISKPAIEIATNKNLYTGQDIVPASMRNLPKDQQVKKNTSGTARLIGGATGLSPLTVQNEVQTMFGGAGPQALTAIDSLLNKGGVIPDNQVGTKSVGNAMQRRFFQSAGGETASKLDEQLRQGMTPKETEAYDLLHTPRQVDQQGNPIPDNSLLNSQQKATIYLNYPKLQAIDMAKEQAKDSHDPIWDLAPQWRNVVFASRIQLPGQKNTYDQLLQQQPWYKDFLSRQSMYYSSLSSSGAPATGGMAYPEPSAYVQQQMDNKNWRDPDVQAWLKANDSYKQQQLAALGLPALLGASSSSTGGVSAGRQAVQKYIYRQRLKSAVKKLAPKKFKVKTTKLKFPQVKLKKSKTSKSVSQLLKAATT